MIGALVVTHGNLGRELVAAAEMIVGEISHIQAVSVGWYDDVNDARNDIEKRVEEVESGRGVIILTDMFGGTPSNIAFSFHDPGKVDVVTGVNLPMVLAIAQNRDGCNLNSLAKKAQDAAKMGISLAGNLLK